MRWIGAVLVAVVLASCGDSIEERAVDEYRACAASYGLDGGVVGITRGPGDGFAITAPDLPEPAAGECLRRVNAVLGGD